MTARPGAFPRPSAALQGHFTRLWRQLLPVGRSPGTGGYRREAWGDAELEGRAWFDVTATSLGLAVEPDGNGNLWAWWGAGRRGAVVAGSHLDSVPDGGAFDGPLGVVGALSAVAALQEAGFEPERPVAVVAFSDEEGARFGAACVGSKLLTGRLDPQRARALRDDGGTTLEEAMRTGGADPSRLGADRDLVAGIDVFYELHVEQGRHLVHLDRPLGVATAIWPHGRWRYELSGEANHAGATALADRKDPMLVLAAAVLAARRDAGELGAVATIAKVLVHPNGTNAIPSRVLAWLDARAPGQAVLDRVVDEVTAAVALAADAEGVELVVEAESVLSEVAFDPVLGAATAERIGGAPLMATGAGHDAGVLAQAGVPAAMVFVRNPTGVSHSPAEFAADQDCLAGAAALEHLIAGSAGEHR